MRSRLYLPIKCLGKITKLSTKANSFEVVMISLFIDIEVFDLRFFLVINSLVFCKVCDLY